MRNSLLYLAVEGGGESRNAQRRRQRATHGPGLFSSIASIQLYPSPSSPWPRRPVRAHRQATQWETMKMDRVMEKIEMARFEMESSVSYRASILDALRIRSSLRRRTRRTSRRIFRVGGIGSTSDRRPKGMREMMSEEGRRGRW